MSCYICFEDFVDDEAPIVRCNNHDIHAECYLLWHQARKSSDAAQTCLVCHAKLPEKEMLKVSGLPIPFKMLALQFIEDDNSSEFRKWFKQQNHISENTLMDLVYTAMSCRAFNTLQYLKRRIVKKSGRMFREKLMLKLWLSKTEFGLQWIFGKLDKDYGLGPIPKDLDQEISHLLAKDKLYIELFWLFKAQFINIENDTRISIAGILFRGLQAKLWRLDDEHAYPESPVDMFLVLCDIYPHLTCLIMGEICPKVALTCINYRPTFESSGLVSTLI